MEQDKKTRMEELGGQMSFLEHLDEFRKRLVYSLIVIAVAFVICWNFSGVIYNFLAIPVREALTNAQRLQVKPEGLTGEKRIQKLTELKRGDVGKYVFDRSTNIGMTVVSLGATVEIIVEKDSEGNLALFTNEPLITNNAIIPKGIKLPVLLTNENSPDDFNERLIVTTAQESFTLYITVSLYSAIALSLPFILLQVWGFISPALYKNERKYVTPFIFLSTISFILGTAFAYYILFPPAVGYLLWLGQDFQLLLRATDYFDLIIIIMMAMGLIFQMPAITYVLSRIGIVSAGLLIKSWKIALVVMLVVAAFVSPTGDIPNLMLFALPMFFLYVISIGIAWIFGKKRQQSEEDIF
jgi:sec-independent protein translocase protein TatC